MEKEEEEKEEKEKEKEKEDDRRHEAIKALIRFRACSPTTYVNRARLPSLFLPILLLPQNFSSCRLFRFRSRIHSYDVTSAPRGESGCFAFFSDLFMAMESLFSSGCRSLYPHSRMNRGPSKLRSVLSFAEARSLGSWNNLQREFSAT